MEVAAPRSSFWRPRGRRSSHELEGPSLSQVLVCLQCRMQRVGPGDDRTLSAGCEGGPGTKFLRSGTFPCAGKGGRCGIQAKSKRARPIGFEREGNVDVTPRGRKRRLRDRPALFNGAGVVVSAGALAIVLLVNGSGELGVLEAGHGIIDVPRVPSVAPSSPPSAARGGDAPVASTGVATSSGVAQSTGAAVSTGATTSTGVATSIVPPGEPINASAGPSLGAQSKEIATATAPVTLATAVVQAVPAVQVSGPPAAAPTGAASPRSATSGGVGQAGNFSGGVGSAATVTSSVVSSAASSSRGNGGGNSRGNGDGWGNAQGNGNGWGNSQGDGNGWGNGHGQHA